MNNQAELRHDTGCSKRSCMIGSADGLDMKLGMRVVEQSACFDSEITAEKDGTIVPTNSIMQLTMLAATSGSLVTLEARGIDHSVAIEVIGDLLSCPYPEELPLIRNEFSQDLRGMHISAVAGKFANLKHANLSRAVISATDLRGMDFTGSNLNMVQFQSTDLREALFGETIMTYVELDSANLEETDLSSLNLLEANLSHAKLRGAVLRKANLLGANLSGADLRNVDLSEARLYRANLSDAKLESACLKGVDLKNADLSRVDMRNANLSSSYMLTANLNESNLDGANLQGADVRWADLGKASLVGASLKETNFRKANLRDATLGSVILEVQPTRILIIQTKRSWNQTECAVLMSSPSLSSYVLDFLYVEHEDDRLSHFSGPLFMFEEHLLYKVRTFLPDIILVHTGHAFLSDPRRFRLGLKEVKRNYPHVEIGLEEGNADTKETIGFDTNEELKHLLDIVFFQKAKRRRTLQ